MNQLIMIDQQSICYLNFAKLLKMISQLHVWQISRQFANEQSRLSVRVWIASWKCLLSIDVTSSYTVILVQYTLSICLCLICHEPKSSRLSCPQLSDDSSTLQICNLIQLLIFKLIFIVIVDCSPIWLALTLHSDKTKAYRSEDRKPSIVALRKQKAHCSEVGLLRPQQSCGRLIKG